MDGLTRQVGAFIAAMKDIALPRACADAARFGIADCVGVLIAGADEPAPQLVAELVADGGARLACDDAAPVLPSGHRVSAADAALINGVAAHVLDYDDVALAGHTSAVLVPAILAEGWALGSSGTALLKAYVAGYETWALLAELEPGSFHELGFHPTAVHGTLATAAACASLRGLDASQAAHAVALAASLAAGLVANFGSMAKSLHAGRAAQSGVVAARLAAKGYTASLDVLEHRTGFLRAHSPSGKPDLREADHRLGEHWRLPTIGIHIKRYPICYATHRSIDAMLDLVQQHDLQPQHVRSIHVHTGETQLLMLRNHLPQTGLEAKFSMQFAMASAILARRVGLRELSDEFVLAPQTQALMKQVQCTTTRELVVGWDQPYAPYDSVRVVLADGSELHSEKVTHPKGSWQRPMARAELQAKFSDCVDTRLGAATGRTLFDQLWDLDRVANTRELALLAPGQERLRA